MTDSPRPLRLARMLCLLASLLLAGVAFAAPDPPKGQRSKGSQDLDALEARFGALSATPRPGQANARGDWADLARAAARLASPPGPSEAEARLRHDRALYLVGRIALARSLGGEEDQTQLAVGTFRALTEGGQALGHERTPTDNEWLRHFAYLGLVEALGSSRPEQALELAEDLCGVDWWYSPEAVVRAGRDADPETRAALASAVARDRAHLRLICRQAHQLRARLLLEGGRWRAALEVLASFDEQTHGRGWRDRPGAIELIALRARARIEGGAIEEGVAELVRALEIRDPKSGQGAGGEVTGERESESLRGALARGCKALAELARVGEGVLQSPAASFYAAYGDQAGGDACSSLLNYRRVLHLARTQAERERWVPRAAREVGAQLFRRERYLEAALAYELVCSEFPEHAFAAEAARFASSALKRASAQLGSPPGGTLWTFRRRVEGSIGQLLPAQAALRTRLAELADLIKAGRWSQAAAGYAKVAAGQADSPLRVRVLSEAGRSAWRAYREAPRRLRDPRVLGRSRAHLREAIRVAEARAWSEEEASARRRLAAIEAAQGNLLTTLELLEPFESRLSETSSAFAARQLQAQALLNQGGPEAAVAAERCFAAAGPGQGDARARFAYDLVSRIRAWGETRANQTARPEERRRARRRAAHYAGLYLEAQQEADPSLSRVRLDVLTYLARVCGEGGSTQSAFECAEAALVRSLSADKPSPKVLARVARLRRIRALALGELDPARGIAALRTELRRGRLRPRGPGLRTEPVVLVARNLSKETYPARLGGQTRQVRVWQLTLHRGGKQELWAQVQPASGGDTRFVLVPGPDPNAQVRNSQVRVLELTQTRDLELLSALEVALWARYRATGSQRLLTESGGLSQVLAELLSVVRGSSDAGYLARVSDFARGSFARSDRLWEIQLSCLRLKLARQLWGEVESEIRGFELLGKLRSAPPSVRAELERLRQRARAKSAR
jgi:hypothetical protein